MYMDRSTGHVTDSPPADDVLESDFASMHGSDTQSTPELQCRRPSYENPMGNHLPSDYDSDRFPEALSTGACKWSNVRDDIDVEYYKNMYRNAMDLYDRETGKRSFYTMPSTTIPNDREAFQKWCYRPPSVFKEGGDNALLHVDPRYERRPPRHSYII
jgi:hypothetical protein